jgi:hypothetical protein
MNAKNFLVSGIVGGIVEFFLGWLFYGMLFKDYFPSDENMNMLLIFLGCMTVGLFIAFIYTRWAHITTMMTGLKSGAVIGLFLALYYDFFDNAMKAPADIDCKVIGLDILITIVMTSIVGAVIAFVNGKMPNKK